MKRTGIINYPARERGDTVNYPERERGDAMAFRYHTRAAIETGSMHSANPNSPLLDKYRRDVVFEALMEVYRAGKA